MKGVNLSQEAILWMKCATQRGVIIRAICVSFIVGTCITAVNSGDQILHGEYPIWWKVCLNYFVPFVITMLSSTMTKIVAMKDLSDCPIEVGVVRSLVLEKGMAEAVYISLSEEILVYNSIEP